MYKGKNVSAADKIECSQEQKAYNELNKTNDKVRELHNMKCAQSK